MSQDPVPPLAALGFTELEARVYTYLVQHPQATAYRVAQDLGKAVANTYKAVESLQQRGAVIVDETGESRLCRAVPPAQLLGALRRTFEREHTAAQRALASLLPVEQVGGIFTLSSVEQVYERCARMLESAEEIVLLDAFPAVVERLAPAVEAAAARGLIVAAQVYARVELRGVETVHTGDSRRTLERWPGQWLCLIIDGAEYLFAYLDREGQAVHQAIWSDSAFLAWIQHSYLSSALGAGVLEQLLREKASPQAIDAALVRTERWSSVEARGFRYLRAHFAR